LRGVNVFCEKRKFFGIVLSGVYECVVRFSFFSLDIKTISIVRFNKLDPNSFIIQTKDVFINLKADVKTQIRDCFISMFTKIANHRFIPP
jgi:hypothetical protein